MDKKKNDLIGDIFTSYGPFVGKVCENTNTQLYNDNIIESISNSINENSIGQLPMNVKYPNLSQIDLGNNIENNVKFVSGGSEISNTFTQIEPSNTISKKLKIKSVKIPSLTHENIILNNNTQNTTNIDNQTANDDEPTSFFNYKIQIFSYKISIWILILILLILICIGYFIYKYWYLKNTNIITYKKNSLNDNLNNNDLQIEDISSNDTESPESESSTSTETSSNNSTSN